MPFFASTAGSEAAWTFPSRAKASADATSGLNKLIAGETIKIKTQRGKDISVKYVGTTVQNA